MHMARHMERMHRDLNFSTIKTEIKTEDDGDKSEMGAETD